MKRLLNTLFVTTQGAYLARKGETVVVREGHETKLRVPVHTLGGIVCFGRVSCSPQLMHLCAERDITISFLSLHGRFYARVQGPVSGNVLLRREQYRRADKPKASASIARAIVAAKVANSRSVLQRAARDHPGKVDIPSLQKATREMARTLKKLRKNAPLAGIRGYEGQGARTYFGVFDELITAQQEDFQFEERNRRPPTDKINSLLSFCYTLLLHDCISALESVGLDPAVGYLHRDRPGQPGLALDLMEEFRAFLADRVTLSLINRRQLTADDFRTSESGAVTMSDNARKQVLVAYQERKQTEIHHPFLEEKMATGLLPYSQALLLARHLRGDLDGYAPFLWK